MSGRRWTAFLDRDGTLNAKAPDGGYVGRPEDLDLLPGAAEAVRRLNHADWTTVVVTNQRGIATGAMTEHDLALVHAHLRDLLREGDARLDLILHCPHGEGTCACRKPRPGLLLLARELIPTIDFGRAVMIGDTQRDLGAATAVGIPAVALADGLRGAAFQAETLLAGVQWAIGRAGIAGQ